MVKRCKKCGGAPKYVYYNVLSSDCPDAFDFDEDEVFSPMILFKRIECSECGSTVPQLSMRCEDAEALWNAVNSGERGFIERHGEEMCSDVGPPVPVAPQE